jgi:hypothetical protein
MVWWLLVWWKGEFLSRDVSSCVLCELYIDIPTPQSFKGCFPSDGAHYSELHHVLSQLNDLRADLRSFPACFENKSTFPVEHIISLVPNCHHYM